jgi:hypothetical protein
MFGTPTSRGGRGRGARAAFRTGDKLIFPMTTVPLGWVLDTTHNDKALRIVNTAGGGSGGSSSFSTVFAKTATDPTTLTTTQIPSHSHRIATYDEPTTHSHFAGQSPTGHDSGYTGFNFDASGIEATGSGGSHAHGMDIRVQYVDAIIGRKL